MISKTKFVIIGLLCISFTTISHSLSNEQLEKQHQQQCNQSKTSDDWAKNTIPEFPEILKQSKNLHQTVNKLNAQLKVLKTEMKPQIEQCLRITHYNLNISTIRRVDEYSKNSTQPANNSMETKSTQQNETYFKNITESTNRLNQILDDLETKHLKNFTNLANSLNRKFGDLEMKFKQDSKHRPHDEIVQDIRSDRFSGAEQKLKQADEGTYKKAVREVYNNQIDNVVLLKRFLDSINDTEIKNNLYQALHDEIKIDNVLPTKALSKVSWSVFGEELPNLIAGSIQENGVEVYLSPMKCFQCMVDINEQAIGKLWANMTAEQILKETKYESRYVTIEQKIAFRIALFRELERRGELNTSSTVTLALRINSTMEDAGYQSVSSEIKSQFEAIKNKLPRSIRNLVFSSKVCIKNTRYNEYLYAGTDSDDIYKSYSTKIFHLVYTRMLGDGEKSPEFKWRVSFGYDREVYFLNDYFKKEYLCAYQDRYDHQRRFAWTQEFIGGPFVAWDLEFDGGSIYMKSPIPQEYLFADVEFKKGGNGRHAFAYTPKDRPLGSEWQFEDCS